MSGLRSGETVCGDGALIRHLESGAGTPVVLLPGWSQPAQSFESQLRSLSDRWRVVAIDHRGHGRSSTPPIGYHLHRLAADVHDVLTTHDLDGVHLLGHSMGAAVVWSYLELFGTERLRSLVFIDQMPCALRNPGWTDDEAADAGATMDPAGLFEFTDLLRGQGPDPRGGFLSDVTSPGFPAERLAWLAEQNGLFDRRYAADLIFDVATHDWRALIPHIELPTLVIAGGSVNVPLASQRWIHRRVGGSRFACVTGSGGGTHFPHLENPSAFDTAVVAFLEGPNARP
ncbi:alpha/beta fold hydrolase [Mycolicibacterium xanthum]|uniref:alpha/beta fold hydrolase n=1 Tax=Mycolicibacterium xanthum TaxID=2796469 RepID=UPI0027DEFB39|nr:alpha/beta hydrolase [Mycolicibacterium xanthum]